MGAAATDADELSVQQGLLEFAIGRVDEWIRFASTKASFIIALDSAFILALAGVALTGAQQRVTLGRGERDLLALSLTGCLASLLLSLWVLHPVEAAFVRGERQQGKGHLAGAPPKRQSLLFYGTVAGMSPHEFQRRFDSLTQERVVEDLIEQHHVLCTICQAKYRLYGWSAWAFAAAGLLPAFLLACGRLAQ